MNRKIECLLPDQSAIRAGQRLLADFSRRNIGQGAALQPVVVRVLAGDMHTLHRVHNNRPSEEIVPKAQPDPACIRDLERSKDLLV